MWKNISSFKACFPGKTFATTGRIPRAKFLLDENVPSDLRRYLKTQKCSVKTVKEIGATGASDNIVQQIAQKERRMLITHDHDFFDFRRFSLKLSPGVIIIEESRSDVDWVPYNLRRIIIPRPHFWEETKVVMCEDTLTCHYIGTTGNIETCKLRFAPGLRIEKWVD